MLKKIILHNRNGSGMLIGMFALLVLLAFGMSFLSVAMSSVINSKRGYVRARALEVAEAGVERAISYLRGTAPDGSTDGSWRTVHPSSLPDNHQGDSWYQENLTPTESFKLCVRSVAGSTERIMITSVSTVTHGSAKASVTLKVMVERHAENVCPWNNVIFGGVGQAGRSINGNVVMRGSVHLLGDGEAFTDIDGDGNWDDDEPYSDTNHNGTYDLGEPFTDVDGDGHRDAKEPYLDVNGNGMRDPALTVTDMASEISGSANIGNNYDGIPTTLLNKIPSIPTTYFGGQNVESLSAKLRVKHGRVNVSGAATVGDPNYTGNNLKETMDAVYVNDGYGGNKGSASVYSDNGVANGYDLGDGLVTFPALIDPVPGYGTYKDYLRANALVIGGDLSLTPGIPYSRTDGTNSISYDGDGNVQISGIVYVDGDIHLNRSSNRPTLTYGGRGTLVADEDINIHCNIIPETGFPMTDALGLVASKNMWVACGSGDSQLTMSLAGYAQYKVKIAKQCKIAGTFVASYYEMHNVPHIYQVPELANHLPPGLPGGDPIYIVTIDVKSWQDMGGSGGNVSP